MLRARTSWVTVACAWALLLTALPFAAAQAPEPPVNDPSYQHQWALQTIKAPQAWSLATGAGIKVAILDTGVRLSHEDLQCPAKLEWHTAAEGPNRASNFDFPSSPPDDGSGEGTHVAGIIGACADNGRGIAGVAPEATLLPFASSKISAGDSQSVNRVISGIQRAVAEGAHVVQLTERLRPRYLKYGALDALKGAVAQATAAGAVIVAGAGDDGGPLCAWAEVPGVICVGATTARGLLAPYSSFPFSPSGIGLVAPGGAVTEVAGGVVSLRNNSFGVPVTTVYNNDHCKMFEESVLSLMPVDKDLCSADGLPGYRLLDGTATAAAHVAGVAALVYERVGGTRSDTAAQEVVNALTSSARDSDTCPILLCGEGLIDALGAVTAIGPTPSPTSSGPTPTPTPTVQPEPSQTATPTFSPEPSETSSPTPSAESTPTPQPSETPTPTPSPASDPFRSDQWALEKIGAPGSDAWQDAGFEFTGDGIRIAVMDRGMDINHPDLNDPVHCPGKLERLVNYEGGPFKDNNRRGTAVSGLIAACTGNGIGISGVAPDAHLLLYKLSENTNTALEDMSMGNNAHQGAIYDAIAAGAHVIVLPDFRSDLGKLVPRLSAQAGLSHSLAALGEAINSAVARGVVVVGPAGDNVFPWCTYAVASPKAICAAGTDSRDVPAHYHVGRDVGTPEPFAPDNLNGPVLHAPGGLAAFGNCGSYAEPVLSLTSPDLCSNDGLSGYETFVGTAIAAAHVAGAAALVYDALGGERSSDHGAEVVDALLDGARDLGPADRDPIYADGLIDIVASVAEVLSDPEVSPSPSRAPSPTPSGSPLPPVVADDPFFLDGSQWALGTIRAPDVWSRATGSGIRVATIGSGINLGHEDLAGCPGKIEIVPGADLTAPNTSPEDVTGTGTHVAGLIGACTGNGTGIAGVAPHAMLMPFQVVAEDDGDAATLEQVSPDDVAKAIRLATDRGAHVITLAIPGISVLRSPDVDRAIDRALTKGTVVVVPAGDAPWSRCEPPADVLGVVCVGSVDRDDRKTTQSSFPSKDDGLALVAPGGIGGSSTTCDLYAHNVVSTFPAGLGTCVGEAGEYRTQNGSVVAAAHVAGVAALLYERSGGERSPGKIQKIHSALLDGARDLAPAGPDPIFGAGRLDALASMDIFDDPAGRQEPERVVRLAPSFENFRPGRTTRVSESAAGAELDDRSVTPSISANGRYVAFTSVATNLPESNGHPQAYVKDTITGELELVSKNSRGVAGNDCSYEPSISGDGRYVTFTSAADNLVKGDTNSDDVFRCTFTDVFVHDRSTGRTTRVSVTSTGVQAVRNGGEVPKSWEPDISRDGTKVLFWSNAANLTADSRAGSASHLYVVDRDADGDGVLDEFAEAGGATVELVDVAEDGTPSSSLVDDGRLSGNGRYVTFTGSGLAGDDDFHTSVYVRDLSADKTIEVSINGAGEQANTVSEQPDISDDGRFVVFQTYASNLVPDDTDYVYPLNYTRDIFIHDRDADSNEEFDEAGAISTERVSIASNGAEVLTNFRAASISATGRYIGMVVDRGILPDETHRNRHGFTIDTILLHDQLAGTTELIPVSDAGEEANDHSGSFFQLEHGAGIGSDNLNRDALAISADGRYVAFHSYADNLTANDDNRELDVYLRDRGPAIGPADIASNLTDEGLHVSGWATTSHARVAFADGDPSQADPHANELGADLTSADIILRPHRGDLLLRWEVAHLPTTRPGSDEQGRVLGNLVPPSFAGRPGVMYVMRLSIAGRTYEVRGTRLAGASPRASKDAYFGLFACEPTCAEEEQLVGGIGTVGKEARVSLPLESIGVGGPATLSSLSVFTGVGDTRVGVVHQLDDVSLELAPEYDGLPAPSVSIGVAPESTASENVSYAAPPADFDGSAFTGVIPLDMLPPAPFDVWVKVCLERACAEGSQARPEDIIPFPRITLPPEEDEVVLPPPPPDEGLPEPERQPQRPPIGYLRADPGTTRVIAGGSYGDGLDAREATLLGPRGVAVWGERVFVSDTNHAQIRFFDLSDRRMHLLAGSDFGFRDGPGDQARFREPEGLDADAAGNVYVADRFSDRVRLIDRVTREVTTFAGTGRASYGGDGGPATDAALNEPRDVAVAPDGSVYVADYRNLVVRRISPDGRISTFAGTGTEGPALDGPATRSPVVAPSSVAIGPDGDVYIAEEGSCLVRRVDVAAEPPTITTVAGSTAVQTSHTCFSGGDGGPGTAARLANPTGIEVDSAGRLYIAEAVDGGRARVVTPGADGTVDGDPDDVITTLAGNGEQGCVKTQGPTQSGLATPSALASGGGRLFMTTGGAFGATHCSGVFEIAGETLTRLAGDDLYWDARSGMPAASASFKDWVTAVAYGPDGQPYFVADGIRIWTIDLNGKLRIVAGPEGSRSGGSAGQDVPALHAQFGFITGIEFDERGRLWIADRGADRLKVLVNNVVRTVAGNGKRTGDDARVGLEGPAKQIRLSDPYDVAVAPDGSIYFTEQEREGRIRRLANGRITTIAGDVDYSGDCRDDGNCIDSKYFDGDGENVNDPTAKIEFQFPQGIDVGPDGSIYIADHWNHRIRRIAADGMVSTVAGDGGIEHGTEEPRPNGFATKSSIAYPNNVVVDDDGNIFISDAPDSTSGPTDSSIWHVSPRGMLTRIAGTGIPEFGPSGPSLETPMLAPGGMALTPAGLLVADKTTLRLVAPDETGWPDPAVSVRCDPFGYSDRTGDITYEAASLTLPLAKSWLDLRGGDVVATESEIRVTLDVVDLAHPGGLHPAADDFGSEYAWYYTFQDPDIQDASTMFNSNGASAIVVYYIAAHTPSVGVPPTFEYGIGKSGPGGLERMKFGDATGSIDVAKDRIVLTAPVDGFSDFPPGFEPHTDGVGLEPGELVVDQNYSSGVLFVPNGELRQLDNAPTVRGLARNSFFDSGTRRSYEIGDVCVPFGPPEEEAEPPVGPEPPIAPDEYVGVQWAPTHIAAPAAWEQTATTGRGIKVAVIDSGIDLQHEDFKCPGKLGRGAAVRGGVVDTTRNAADDAIGHGTQVAGILGACTNNGTGIAGIAPGVTLMPYRVMDTEGGIDFHDVGAAVRHATQSGAHVINLSLGPVASAAAYAPDVLEENDTAAIEDAISSGVVVVAAAGNDSFPLCSYPALVKDVVCVGATDRFDLKAWYSSFPNKLDAGPALVAPGGSATPFCDFSALDIVTTTSLEGDNGCDSRNGYQTASGTSLAAPHVAGTAALVYEALGGSRSPEARRAVVDAMLSSAVDYGTRGFDPAYGYGRVDALAAVTSVLPDLPASPEPRPSTSSSTDPSQTPPPPPSGAGSPQVTNSPSGTPSASPSSPPALGSVSTTLSANRDTTTVGKRVRVSGFVTADDECDGPFDVEILRRTYGKNVYRSIETIEVTAGEKWSAKLSPKRSVFYAARLRDTATCQGLTSTPVPITTRVKVIVNPLPRCRSGAKVVGFVRPNNAGTKVLLQDRHSKGWRTIGRDRLNRRSRFSFELSGCNGRYRVMWPKQGAPNAPGSVRFSAQTHR